jgi:membrane protein insertase Oxa1/YidC/SpoIIIJ
VLPAIPYYALVALMVGSTWYQQRQMQRASAGPSAQQAQLMARIMPVFLGVISISISAGVLVYWVTTNLWQIGQQQVMLRGRLQESNEVTKAKSGKTPRSGKPAETRTNGDRTKRNAGSRKKRRKR